MTVTGDMEDGDRIVVLFHNVKVQSLAAGSRMPVEAAITVTDKLSGADDGRAYEATIDTITVNPPEPEHRNGQAQLLGFRLRPS